MTPTDKETLVWLPVHQAGWTLGSWLSQRLPGEAITYNMGGSGARCCLRGELNQWEGR